MSYEIIYSKQFVKLRKTGEVIPMLLMGSNNTYEIAPGGGTGPRARDWENFRYYNRKGKLSEKPEVIFKKLEADIAKCIREHRKGTDYSEPVKPEHIREHWGYYSSIAVGGGSCAGTSWTTWWNLFANGIKQAKTIEELNELGIRPYLYAYTNAYHPNPDTPKDVYLTTEKDYFAAIGQFREWTEKNDSSFYLHFSPGYERVLKYLRDARRVNRKPVEKADVEQDHYFVLANEHGNGLVKYTSRGYRYSYNKDSGSKRFRTEAEAEKYRKELVAKGRHMAHTWKVERVGLKASFRVPVNAWKSM